MPAYFNPACLTLSGHDACETLSRRGYRSKFHRPAGTIATATPLPACLYLGNMLTFFYFTVFVTFFHILSVILFLFFFSLVCCQKFIQIFIVRVVLHCTQVQKQQKKNNIQNCHLGENLWKVIPVAHFNSRWYSGCKCWRLCDIVSGWVGCYGCTFVVIVLFFTYVIDGAVVKTWVTGGNSICFMNIQQVQYFLFLVTTSAAVVADYVVVFVLISHLDILFDYSFFV